MKKYLLFLVLIVLLTGCNQKEKSVKVSMKCKNDVTVHTIKKGDVLACELLGEEYEITIVSATSERVKVKVNEYGLTDTNSLLDKKDSFEFSKDESLKLHTQSTDYQEKLILSYES